MKSRLVIQNCYYKVFKEHPFTTISRMGAFVGDSLIRLNYQRRPWAEYPVFHTKSGKALLFIHIPKCGGTSVANVFDYGDIRHLPASVFKVTDSSRYRSSIVFTIVRNPTDRLASILMHFRSSMFASDRERGIFADCGITEERLADYILLMLRNQRFRSKLFATSEPGRSGFSVSQAEYLMYSRDLLVENIFSLDRLDLLEKWLSRVYGVEMSIGHSNSSKRSNEFVKTSELEAEVRKYLPDDYLIYDKVNESGGAILAGETSGTELKQGLIDA